MKDIDIIKRTFNNEKLIELFYSSKELNLKIEVIIVLFNLGFVKKSKELLEILRKDFKEEVWENLRYYEIVLDISISENDEFTKKTIFKRIVDRFSDRPEHFYKYAMAENIEEMFKIYNKDISPNIIKLIRNKKLENFYLSAYFSSFLGNIDHYNYPKILNILFKKISSYKKNNIKIDDIGLCENIVRLVFFFTNQNPDCIAKIINNLDIIDNAIKLLEDHFLNFENKKRYIIEDIIINVNDILAISNKKYINNNKAFKNRFKESISIYNQYLIEELGKEEIVNYKELIRKLIDEKDKFKITMIVFKEMAKDNILDLKIELEKIEATDISTEIKVFLHILILYLDFINGEKITIKDLNLILEEIRVPQIYQLLIKYENGVIKKEELLTNIQKLNSVEFSLHGFKRVLKSVYDRDSFNPILTLLERMKQKTSETERIFEFLFSEIRDEELVITFFEFDKLVDVILLNSDFKIRDYIIYIAHTFKSFSEKYINIVIQNLIELDSSPKENIHIDRLDEILYNYLIFCIQSENGDNKEIEKYATNIIKDKINNKPPLFLLIGIIFPSIFTDYYIEILDYLHNKYLSSVEELKEYEKSIIYSVFINLLGASFKIENHLDEIYIKDNVYYANYVEPLMEHYKALGIRILKENNVSEMNKLSLIGAYISKIVFKNPDFFGLKSYSIPQNAKPKKILEDMGKIIGEDKLEKARSNLLAGGKDTSIFSVFNLHSFLKKVQQLFDNEIKNNLFPDVKNDNIYLNNKKIVHSSTLILLAVMDKLKIVEENDLCYITESIYNDVVEKHAFNIGDLADGILDERVYYEDSLERLAAMMKELKDKKRILFFPVGNVFSSGDEEGFPDFDKDIIKGLKNETDIPYVLITDDSFLFEFINNSSGAYALAIEAYIKRIIGDNELLKITKDLNSIGYKNLFSRRIISELINILEINKSNDTLKEIIKILNDSV